MIVVADTSPINYLVLIGYQDVLGELFGKVVVPEAVCEELLRESTPKLVREWMTEAPGWLEVVSVRIAVDPELEVLDPGERQAIALAEELSADLLLIDDLRGREAARARKLAVTGTIGILELADKRGLLALSDAIDRLLKTSFRISREIIEELNRKQRSN